VQLLSFPDNSVVLTNVKTVHLQTKAQVKYAQIEKGTTHTTHIAMPLAAALHMLIPPSQLFLF
jgi:hypothetical protein